MDLRTEWRALRTRHVSLAAVMKKSQIFYFRTEEAVDILFPIFLSTAFKYRVTIKEIDTFNVVLKRNY